MTDPKAKLQEEIERRAEKYGELQDEWPYNEIAKDGFEDGAEFALELMQAREAKLVAALRFYADPENWIQGQVSDLDRQEIVVSDWWVNKEAITFGGDTARRTLKELGLAEGGESGEG